MLDSSMIRESRTGATSSKQAMEVPFSAPDIGELEVEAVAAVLRSGWITSGPQMRGFEDEFSHFVGGGVNAIAVNSATAGLHLALEACGVGPGDEVIVPTWTFTATAEVVTYVGARPCLVDVDPVTQLLDLEGVARAITPRTRAVIPVHVGGLSVDPQALRAVVGPEIRIIEDAAHALPATRSGIAVGSCRHTDAAVFSFYANKTMTTGEGGMITTPSAELADRARLMRLHGIDRDAFARYTSMDSSWAYDVVHAGMKYNLSDIAAAIGRVQLSRCREMQARRQSIAQTYLSAFSDLPVGLPATGAPGDVHAWHLFVLRFGPDSPLDRSRFIKELGALQIGTSVHFIPLHRLSHWRNTLGCADEDFPVATKAFGEVVSIPIYSRMTDAQVAAVVEVVRKTLGA